MKGLLFVDFPSSRKRRRSEPLDTMRKYSTILSQRASFLSSPTRNPRNFSGVGSAGGVAGGDQTDNPKAFGPRRLFFFPPPPQNKRWGGGGGRRPPPPDTL